ncbi:MAG: DUF4826 family protein [Saccharospirillum sp.]|nr:DUF4826 family protein [Saccharospirillum sp.]
MSNLKRLTHQPDYRNRFNRKLWLNERQSDLRHYFDSRNILTGGIEAEPFWAKVPYVSIWKIRSVGTPGFDGWYGMAGDHPCDIVGMNNFSDRPRDILRYFAAKWAYAAQRLKRGEDYPEFRIERIEERHKIGLLIEDRSNRLQRWVDENDLWGE